MASSSIPKTMKGVVINKNGGSEVLEYKTDLPLPELKDGEVLVKNDIIGINYIDTYFRSGLYPVSSFPLTLGREAAGTIVSTGPGQIYSLATGDRVVFLGEASYAEYTAAPAIHTYKLPSGISNEIAAAGILQGLTAITLIEVAHRVKKGDWILVHAIAGGMGGWLVQLLHSIGAHVIGTASTPEKREQGKKAGADVVLEYADKMGNEAFVKKVKELTGGKGVAAVFDGVGKSTFDVSLDCVALQGSMISFGNASGAVPPLTIARLGKMCVRLMRPSLFGFISTREEFEHYTKDLFDIMEREKLDVGIHKTYALSDVAQAHEDLEGRRTTGKLLLKP